jgi:hypothetical protein
MTRRRFAFWIGFGLFSLAEKLGLSGLDRLAAATMRAADDGPLPLEPEVPLHWTAAENRTWRWFEREVYVDGKWRAAGVTFPIHKKTGEQKDGKYLDESLVPAELREGERKAQVELPPELEAEFEGHDPHPKRRARHGRPPSKWLRSLDAEELGIWLRTIDVPEAGVSGMTFWEHLTRDHMFIAEKIEGLTEEEQAKLHAAAHFGY